MTIICLAAIAVFPACWPLARSRRRHKRPSKTGKHSFFVKISFFVFQFEEKSNILPLHSFINERVHETLSHEKNTKQD